MTNNLSNNDNDSTRDSSQVKWSPALYKPEKSVRKERIPADLKSCNLPSQMAPKPSLNNGLPFSPSSLYIYCLL